mmetsp:Transcript_40117/g.95848  ORF Transcript_40117/g.95848 Transcript_40117/m.95848 type:complete len:217 (+) Transcript_40117:346-996(+)
MSASSPRSWAPLRRRRMAAKGVPASAKPSSPAVRSEASDSTCRAENEIDLLLARAEDAQVVEPPEELPQARLLGKKPPARLEASREDLRVLAREVQEVGPGRSARFTDSITRSCSEGSSALGLASSLSAAAFEVDLAAVSPKAPFPQADPSVPRRDSRKAATALEISLLGSSFSADRGAGGVASSAEDAFARRRSSWSARSPLSSAGRAAVSAATC